jgi:hypothetical protein
MPAGSGGSTSPMDSICTELQRGAHARGLRHGHRSAAIADQRHTGRADDRDRATDGYHSSAVMFAATAATSCSIGRSLS